MKWFRKHLGGGLRADMARRDARRCRGTACRAQRSKRSRALVVFLVLAGVLALRAELREWVRFTEAGTALRDVFFESVSLPSGDVLTLRPAHETVEALSDLIEAGATEADLYALRAQEAERKLDFETAEADWKKFAELTEDPAEGQLALADFYDRRLRPEDEVEALLAVGRAETPPSERFFAPEQQRSWIAFERSLAVIEAHDTPDDRAIEQYQVWLERYPERSALYSRFLDFLVGRERLTEAEQLIERYRSAFPEEPHFPIQAEARLARHAGSDSDALAVYDEAFEPLWPQGMVNEYFGLLDQARQLRSFLDRARAALASNPEDLRSAAWIFHYYARQGNNAAANAVLTDFRRNKESGEAPWRVPELVTLAGLSERSINFNEAARYYYALYSLPTATVEDAERALAGLIGVLLTAPEQPIEFGSGDLSFYRDIAAMDDQPGFLNGIFSLLLNSERPQREYAQQERNAVAYFHRARASELMALFNSRFSYSQRAPALHVRLIEAYGLYGESEGVIRAAREFLEAFPDSPQRTHVALLMANAHAQQEQLESEFETYESLLQELAAKADRVPIGNPSWNSASSPGYGSQTAAARLARLRSRYASGNFGRQPLGPARSPDYARVLDRYLARLISLRREREALTLYAREIERNPDDPGLYERLASFLEQNGLGEQVEQVYRRAIGRFQERSWYHKLARWYLRQQRAGELTRLTREVTDVFSGTELDDYFQQIVSAGGVGRQAYLQVNLYAHERFPHNLTFVRNLMTAYLSRETYNHAAWERLLRQYWFFADDLRSQFLAFLTREGRLESELRALQASLAPARAGRWEALVEQNAAAAQWIAETDLWRCHFETAAPVLRALGRAFPTDRSTADRASTVYRSLAYVYPTFTEEAVALEEGLRDYDPGDRQRLARAGDMLADREHFAEAAPYWNRMITVEPGSAEGYLEAATVFWDYYLFDESLRLLNEGRTKFEDPALYAYETGAIYENKREYEQAIEQYLRGALSPQGSGSARQRLLRLARRTAHRERIDQATAELVEGPNPDPLAVSLRVDVLNAQQRRRDLESFLARLAGQTTSLALLDEVGRLATNHAMDGVRTQVMQRQIELTTDPVENRRLRLSLMRLHESRRDSEAAGRAIDALYQEHPRILGVVRGAVDFHWRNEQQGRALEILLEAAGVSYEDLKKRFQFEAARKATEIERYDFAREQLRPLLEEKPFDAQYLAAMADTYGREGRYDALRDFYREKIEALGLADLPAETKRQRIASLRRGLIPALTELGDATAAVDQYIEIINRFPDDEALVQETAYYADRQGLRQRCIDYYVRTTTESPRDFRYHRVLAWFYTHFEDYDAAIRAYTRAAEVRPNETGILEARASLEERLMRFDEALATYNRLHELTYQNPRWMEKIAEVHARQGRVEEAEEAIRKALVDGRPERPENFFEAARRLEGWNMLEQARPFAARGIELAGSYLFRESRYLQGAGLYAGLMARLRQHDEAYRELQKAWALDPRPAWQSRYAGAVQQIGRTVDLYYTPEEKAAFEAFLRNENANLPPADFELVLIPVAQAAALAELEVEWRHERMMAQPGQGRSATHMGRLVELQRKRLRHNELGGQLEAYWEVYPRNATRYSILAQAAEAYQEAGNENAELRLRRMLDRDAERYLELLLERDPAGLVALSTPQNATHDPDQPANFAVMSGDVELALQAVRARGEYLPFVWTRAYTALVGLYYANQDQEVGRSFREMLDESTIGERIGTPVDRDVQLAGDLWFYYGSRYGEYLGLSDSPDTDAYLPAPLEAAPARASAYAELADYYLEEGRHEDALADYRHALELQTGEPSLHSRVAEVLWAQGDRDGARAEWVSALEGYTQQVERGAVAASFWNDVPELLRVLGGRGLVASLQEPIDDLLRMYVRRNGSYQVGGLLEAYVEAATDARAAFSRVLDFAAEANDQVGYLAALVDARWVPAGSRAAAFTRVLEAAQEQLSRAEGQAEYYARQALINWRIRWVGHLLATKQGRRAQEVLDTLKESQSQLLYGQHAPLVIRAAAMTGELEELLATYRREPRQSPELRYLLQAAEALRRNGETSAAGRVLEFAYSREIERRNLSEANFLGLAELRFEQGREEEGLALLNRMTLVAGEAFGPYIPAAELLTKLGQHQEAGAFLEQRVRAVPWDLDSRRKLGEAQLSAARSDSSSPHLTAVASADEAPYELRVAAAKLLGRLPAAQREPGSEELRLLARAGAVNDREVRRPFFFHAREQAAGRTANVEDRIDLLREAVAINPEASQPRLSFFRAARASGDHRLAVTALMPHIGRSGIASYLQVSDSRFDETESENIYQSWMRGQFLSNFGLSSQERAQIATELGNSMEELGGLRSARLLYEMALQGAVEQPDRSDVGAALDRVKAERSRRLQNARRRPVITKNLEQDRPVRPRLAGANPGGAP